MPKCISLLLSDGTGTRLGADIPKQYIRTSGRMMITRSLSALFKCDLIEGVRIVADSSWHDEIQKDWKASYRDHLESGVNDTKGIRRNGVSADGHIRTAESFITGFSAPGSTRQLSILNGLEDIAKEYDKDTVVLIHDAARPFVSASMLENCISACVSHDGAMPVLPMKDTVYYSEDGASVTKLLEREKIFAGQAPEAFILGKYLDANRALLPKKILSIKGSTEPAVMAGMDIAMIPGEESNFKVTTPADLKRYEEIVNDGIAE